MNYNQVDQLLQGRCHNSKKLSNNTYAIRLEGRLAIRLHSTDILEFFPNGDIKVNNGGWATVTTKARLNEYLPRPSGIYQEDHVWYWSHTNKEFVNGEVLISTVSA